MSELADALDELLMHVRIIGQVVVVTRDDGHSGVALVIDGWYQDGAQEFGMGAEAAVKFWQSALERLLSARERERTEAA